MRIMQENKIQTLFYHFLTISFDSNWASVYLLFCGQAKLHLKISEAQEIDKFRKKKNPPAIGHVLSNNMPELKQGFHFPSFNFFPLL